MDAGNDSTSDFIKVKNGYAVIFNHLNYKANLNLGTRTGTEFDVIALEKTFEKFKITAIVKEDLTLKQIKDEVSKLEDFDFKDFDSFVIVVMSHGLTKNTLFAFDDKYNFNEVIVDPIINKNASLANKPKIFIIQACKGINEPHTCDIQSDAPTNNIHEEFRVPAIADMFFCFATSEDYRAYRIGDKGSFFIQKLCSTLQDYGFEMSINDIMENVGAELRISDFHVQVPSVTKTTTRPIIFVENNNPIRLKLVKSKILKNGYAIIFNQEIFDQLPKRVGTSYDVAELKKTLKNFNISVKVHNDLSIAEIKEEIEKLQNSNFTPYECLIVIVLSHGDENNILMACDEPYEFYETIANPIVNQNETLVAKPKIFLIQACKGSELPIVHLIRADHPQKSRSVPMIMDMFYIFSTYEGYVSFRQTEEGTFFIQTFCQLLNQYKNTLSLNEIVEHIGRKLIQSESKYKQVPTITKTMVKAIYFVEKNSILRDVLEVADDSELMPLENKIEVQRDVSITISLGHEKQKRAFDEFFQKNLFDPSKTEEENLKLKRAMFKVYSDPKTISPQIISEKEDQQK